MPTKPIRLDVLFKKVAVVFNWTYQRALKYLSPFAAPVYAVLGNFVEDSFPGFLTCTRGCRAAGNGESGESSLCVRGFLVGWAWLSTASVDFCGFLIKGGLKGLKTMARCSGLFKSRLREDANRGARVHVTEPYLGSINGHHFLCRVLNSHPEDQTHRQESHIQNVVITVKISAL